MVKAVSIKQFTKDAPCSKVDIWNCFRGHKFTLWRDGTHSVDIVWARSVIGRHVPRALVNAGRAEIQEVDGEMHIRTTEVGEEWLVDGTFRYVSNQPERFQELINPPKRWKNHFKGK